MKVETALNTITGIRKVRFANVVARVGSPPDPKPPLPPTPDLGNSAIFIRDFNNGPNWINDVDVDGFTFDGTKNNAQAMRVQGGRRLRFHKFASHQPKGRVEIDFAENVELASCSVGAIRGTGNQCLLIGSAGSCTDVRILGGHYYSSMQHNIVLGGGANAATGFIVANAVIEYAPGNGLHLARASNGVVIGNRIVENDVYAVQDVLSTSNNVISAT